MSSKPATWLWFHLFISVLIIWLSIIFICRISPFSWPVELAWGKLIGELLWPVHPARFLRTGSHPQNLGWKSHGSWIADQVLKNFPSVHKDRRDFFCTRKFLNAMNTRAKLNLLELSFQLLMFLQLDRYLFPNHPNFIISSAETLPWPYLPLTNDFSFKELWLIFYFHRY